LCTLMHAYARLYTLVHACTRLYTLVHACTRLCNMTGGRPDARALESKLESSRARVKGTRAKAAGCPTWRLCNMVYMHGRWHQHGITLASLYPTCSWCHPIPRQHGITLASPRILEWRLEQARLITLCYTHDAHATYGLDRHILMTHILPSSPPPHTHTRPPLAHIPLAPSVSRPLGTLRYFSRLRQGMQASRHSALMRAT
jgi:hypothetical protein